jgi:hypothetical protein
MAVAAPIEPARGLALIVAVEACSGVALGALDCVMPDPCYGASRSWLTELRIFVRIAWR